MHDLGLEDSANTVVDCAGCSVCSSGLGWNFGHFFVVIVVAKEKFWRYVGFSLILEWLGVGIVNAQTESRTTLAFGNFGPGHTAIDGLHVAAIDNVGEGEVCAEGYLRGAGLPCLNFASFVP